MRLASAYKSVRTCSFKEQQKRANITYSKYCGQIIRKLLVFYYDSIRLVLEHVNVRSCHDVAVWRVGGLALANAQESVKDEDNTECQVGTRP
jgi:hypothetical protein